MLTMILIWRQQMGGRITFFIPIPNHCSKKELQNALRISVGTCLYESSYVGRYVGLAPLCNK